MLRYPYRVAVTIVSVLFAMGLSAAIPGEGRPQAREDFTDPFYRKLSEVRQHRKTQVETYFNTIRHLADRIVDDNVMMNAFLELLNRDRALSAISDLKLDTHYVSHYGEFFDILFVELGGYVFHSLRRESDYHSNLFTGPLAKTKLSRHLRSTTKITFIDYELYPPSGELAAFFAVPVFHNRRDIHHQENRKLIGWFVLQCPLNKLNSILSDRRGLGRTGEVYCVNTEQRMVTQSRFRPEQTELRLKVETLAVSEALASGAGQRIIKDYRGVEVLSSFEAFDIYGTKWVIIAEIDEQEAITEYFKKRSDYYSKQIVQHLSRANFTKDTTGSRHRQAKRIDMNEFAKALKGEVLETSGVATCTAITVVLPNRFGYLAHIGPLDRIYGKPDVGYNDCLGEMLHRIQQHDVYPSEFAELKFTIVATHDGAFADAVDRLLKNSIELSQIKFAYNPKADYANVVLDMNDRPVRIEWVNSAGMQTLTLGSDVEDLGNIVKRLTRKGGVFVERKPGS